jgi:energy-coupling factor transporter ATP-binding protein EcfA2
MIVVLSTLGSTTMQLIRLQYSEFAGTSKQWRIDIDFAPVNLLVGRNATGKTRTLAIINSLAEILRRNKHVQNSYFYVRFLEGSVATDYTLKISHSRVQTEILRVGGKQLLLRGQSGIGQLLSESPEAKQIRFKVPPTEPAISAKRDLIQHPFLEPLLHWSESLCYYPFGSDMGQRVLAFIDPRSAGPLNPGDPNEVIGVYRRGLRTIGEKFKRQVIADMSSLAYPIKSIGVADAPHVRISPATARNPVVFFVQEKRLRTKTWQHQMSAGMFRALSLVILTAFAELSSKPNCILVDDIGEGLDHDRAIRLLRLLVKRAQNRSIQLIMTTNNRFIMNAVQLDYWRGLVSKTDGVRVISPATDPKAFESFRNTGLSNFDFFSSGFMRSRNRQP